MLKVEMVKMQSNEKISNESDAKKLQIIFFVPEFKILSLYNPSKKLLLDYEYRSQKPQ